MFSFPGWGSDEPVEPVMSARGRSAVTSAIDRAAEAILPNFQGARERQAACRGAARSLNMEEEEAPARAKASFLGLTRCGSPMIAVVTLALLIGFCIGETLFLFRLLLFAVVGVSRQARR